MRSIEIVYTKKQTWECETNKNEKDNSKRNHTYNKNKDNVHNNNQNYKKPDASEERGETVTTVFAVSVSCSRKTNKQNSKMVSIIGRNTHITQNTQWKKHITHTNLKSEKNNQTKKTTKIIHLILTSTSLLFRETSTLPGMSFGFVPVGMAVRARVRRHRSLCVGHCVYIYDTHSEGDILTVRRSENRIMVWTESMGTR